MCVDKAMVIFLQPGKLMYLLGTTLGFVTFAVSPGHPQLYEPIGNLEVVASS